jgi:hypothetical protein
MEQKIKNVVVRLPEELHLPLRRKIAELDTSFQHVILEALVGWLNARDAAAAKSWLAKVAEDSRNANRLPPELTPATAEEKSLVAGLLAFLRDPERPYHREMERLLKSMFELDFKAAQRDAKKRRKVV